jgi:poly(hydroxyalkanoate) depolymerase family esterase
MKKIFCLLLIFAPLLAKATNLESFYYLDQEFSYYAPKSASTAPKALLVLMHGCKQYGHDIFEITRIKKYADEKNFYVLMPEQNRFYNYDGCWNWFSTYNQTRGNMMELEKTIQGIQWFQANFNVDKNNIVAAGMSAGAAMANDLAYCYPEVFSGAFLHSGVAFAVAQDTTTAETVIVDTTNFENKNLQKLAISCQHPNIKTQKLKRFVIVHGDNDPRVVPKNGEMEKQQAQSYLEKIYGVGTNRMSNATDGYPYKKTTISKKNSYNIDFYQIEKLVHAWSGGAAGHDNSDPNGPSATNWLVDTFFP